MSSGRRSLFVPALALDLVLLPVDVAGVLRLHFDLQLHLFDQALVRIAGAHPFGAADRVDRRRAIA